MPAFSNIDAALSQFGLQKFRTGQREVITNVLQGQDCLCVMPTGGGKSLCYQMPAVVRDGLTIVVSPLIALMKDQVDTLTARGIPATLINSSLTASEQTQRLSDIMRGAYRLVYIAPERLRNGRFLDAIRATPISLLAIDEAHCISEWGHDFRPDYARLGRFRETLGMVQTIALTATATEKVRADISSILRLSNPKQFITGFARENLHFGAVLCKSEREKNKELLQYLGSQTGSGIIYAATRKRCEAVLELVRDKFPKLPIDVYHAGLSTDQRRMIQEQFMTGKLKAIVATNAFGMGIDKSDLRYVIHYSIPGTLEAYYQEAGRAGRDGLPSTCVLLYCSQDRYVQEFFIENANPPATLVEKVYNFLAQQQVDPIEFTADEIKDRVGSQLAGEAINTSLQILSKTGVIERLEMSGGLAMVRLDSTLPTLVDLLPKEAKVQRKVLRAVEKAVGDRREESVYVSPRYLMQHAGIEKDALNRGLNELRKLECFDYVPPFRGRAIHFRQTGVPFENLEIDFKALEDRKKSDYEKLARVEAFARSPQCRQLTILKYFGDPNEKACGNCDLCRGQAGWPKLEGTKAVETPVTPLEMPVLKPQQLALIQETLKAVNRMHGRLGKLVIAEYLVGSETAKVKSLKLNRLREFGILKDYKKKDVVEILHAMIDAGLLVQKEINANRPTIFVTEKAEAMIIGAPDFPAAVIAAFGFLTQSIVPESDVPKVSVEAIESIVVSAPDSASNVDESFNLSSRPSLSLESAERVEKAVSLPTPRIQVDHQDWMWTAKLTDRGFMLTEIMAIRRMGLDEVIDDLVAATAAGRMVQCEELLDRRTQLAVKNFRSAQSEPVQTATRIDQQQQQIKRLALLLDSNAVGNVTKERRMT